MRAISCFLFLFSLSVVPALFAEEIRVRIMPVVSSVVFRAENLQVNGTSYWTDKEASGEFQLDREMIRNHWYWRLGKVGSGDPQKSVSLLFPQKEILLAANSIIYNGFGYGSLWSVSSQGEKDFDVVAHLDFGTYLAGVISQEMPPSWPAEALKAQAITARSYALAVQRERAHQSYDLESSVLDQVFRPLAEKSPYYQKIQSIVAETKEYNLILRETGETLKAFYHSQCGGKTTTAASVWGQGPDAGVAVDRSCSLATSRWSFRIKKGSLLERLKGFLSEGWPDIQSLNPLRKADKERVEEVKLAFNEGEKRLSANEFRRMMGFGEIKSARFEVRQSGDSFEFHGVGLGHGVGLCQWGARAMAQRGATFREILKHYYPKASLEARHHSQSEEENSSKN